MSQDLILRLLEKHPNGMTKAQILAITKQSPSCTSTCLSKLWKNKDISRRYLEGGKGRRYLYKAL